MTATRSLTHDHLLAAALTETAHLDRPMILDVGCGAGGLLRRLAEGFAEARRPVDLFGFDVTGADSSHYDDFPAATVRMLDAEAPGAPWGERVRLAPVDAPWPVDDAAFDVAVSNQVLEHVTDLDHFMAELSRVLRPGGVSINLFPVRNIVIEGHIGVPFAHWWRTAHRRAAWIRAMNRLGFGAPDGSSDYAERQARYLADGCAYRSLGELRESAGRYGLHTSTRYTGRFVGQKVRQLRGRRLRVHYPAEPKSRTALDAAAVRWLTSMTVTFEKG